MSIRASSQEVTNRQKPQILGFPDVFLGLEWDMAKRAVFNTLSRSKEAFEPFEAGKIRFYSCGPTVWNLVHVGNLRSALVADLFYRYWKHAGYEVNYARNYTDVDDKIIKAARDQGKEPEALANFYVKEVEKDFKAANVLEPHHKPRVTTHVADIVALIGKILENGQAYKLNGNVVFSVDSCTDYGKLSSKNLEDLRSGARVEVDHGKASPLDFYLWKTAKEGEPAWDSPWGKGRPGWHIECSAMISKLFGDQIDVHHGGVDLVFPHHENEIAQSEAATCEKPFSKYWMHHAFVTINEEKMSKSLGNTFLAREFIEKFSGEVARALMLIPHYRSPIDFSPKSISTAIDSLQRVYEAKKVAEDLSKESSSGELHADLSQAVNVFESSAEEAMSDDFHTPRFLAAYFEMLRAYNRVQYEGTKEDRSAQARAFLAITQSHLGEILGLGEMPAREALESLADVRSRLDGLSMTSAPVKSEISEQEIDKLLQAREEARKSKDFKRADEIRDELLAKGIKIKDTPAGVSWSR